METTDIIPTYNLTEEEEKKEILREYRGLLRVLKLKMKPGDKVLLRTAFEMAVEAHKTMRRKSGEPYILHPLAVAKICAVRCEAPGYPIPRRAWDPRPHLV